MIQVMICDDHPIFREGLRRILQQTGDIAVRAEADSGPALLTLLRETRCDVIVLDLSLPGINGLDVLKTLRDGGSQVPILILSTHPEDQYAVRCLKAGASGYVEKAAVPSDLPPAIRKVASGGKHLSAAVAERLAFDLDGSRSGAPHEALSDREYQILCMLASGKATKQIAQDLCLSPATVGTYRSRVMRKLSLKNSAELIRYAIAQHLVDS